MDNAARKTTLGNARLYSAAYRLFNIDGLEPACEDCGQAAIYNGGLAECPDTFVLDGHQALEAGRVFPVCGNTWRMRVDSRFAAYFQFVGGFDTHYGRL